MEPALELEHAHSLVNVTGGVFTIRGFYLYLWNYERSKS
jgi:hypothetical protein